MVRFVHTWLQIFRYTSLHSRAIEMSAIRAARYLRFSPWWWLKKMGVFGPFGRSVKFYQNTHRHFLDYITGGQQWVVCGWWRRSGKHVVKEYWRAGQSGDRIPVGSRYSAPARSGPETHPASYTIGTGSSPGVKRQGSGFDNAPHLAPRLKKE